MNDILMCSEESWYNDNKVSFEYDWWNGKTLKINKIKSNSNIFDIIYKRICSLYDSYLDITGIDIQRYKINDFLGQHVDNHEGHIKNGWHMRYGIVLYYNDNYDGGELEYKDLNIIHKPKARSLMMHGGNILHGTRPVTNNTTRYFSSCFVKGTKEYPVVLNKQIFNNIEESNDAEYK